MTSIFEQASTTACLPWLISRCNQIHLCWLIYKHMYDASVCPAEYIHRAVNRTQLFYLMIIDAIYYNFLKNLITRDDYITIPILDKFTS